MSSSRRRLGPAPTVVSRRTCAGLVLIVSWCLAPLASQVTPPAQPPNEHSFVSSFDRQRITDQELANEIRTNLPGQSLASVQSVTVTVQSCHAGGFIDELLALGGRVNATTSAKFDEVSRNNFVINWTQAMLDDSNKFVEARRTFQEGRRRTQLAEGMEGTPEYGSTSLEADLNVLGVGYFTRPQGDPNRQLVQARSLKILMWVGQETQVVGSANSRWNVLKAVKDIAGVTVNVETAAFYDNLGAGFWRYDTQARQFQQLTEAQYNGLSRLDQREVVRLTGQGTKANFIDTLRRFAAAMTGDSQLFVLLASHGGHNSPVVHGERCPVPERIFDVNSTADETDGFAGDGLCDTGGGGKPLTGVCTLRAALREADDTTGLDEIRFDIAVPPGEVPTIRPRGSLGSLGALWPVIVDGTTQRVEVNGVELREGLVELDGSTAGQTPDGQELAGLELVGEGSTVRGLVINRFGGPGLRIRPTGAPQQGRHVVESNRIGTDVTGQLARPNRESGIVILGIPGNVISHNLVAGNLGRGILIDGSDAVGNHLLDNQLGTNAAGTSPLANAQGDIVIINDANENVLAGNRIGPSNSGRVGIDLADEGITPNDGSDGDTGANELQNFPELSSAVSDGVTMTTIDGTLRSAPGGMFVLEFFANRACGPSGFGPSERSFGGMTVETDAGGMASFSASLPIGLSPGMFVTATATSNEGNTSEISSCIQVGAGVPPGLIEALIAQVEQLSSLNPGQRNSLIAKLEAAQAAIARGNPNAASNQLLAFINEVQALQKTGRLDPATAASLIAQALNIISGLGGRQPLSPLQLWHTDSLFAQYGRRRLCLVPVAA